MGFPPAGGWVTLNKIIRVAANPTDKGIIIYKGKGTKYKKNFVRKECLLLPFKTLAKALNI